MATVTYTNGPDNGSDASFRVWGSALDGTFTTFGWVRTADTGQVNWATVLKPTLASTATGYSIFTMSDSLQATYPVFIKIEYGDTPTVGYPGIWITVGTGSDGAGTLTNIIRSRTAIGTAGSTATTYPCYASGANNRYCCILWPASSTSNSCIGIAIERTKDSSGVDTGDGIMLFTYVSSSYGAVTSSYCPFSPPYSAYGSWNCGVPNGSFYGSFGNTSAVYFAKCWNPGETMPSTNYGVYYTFDLPALTAVPVSMFSGAYSIKVLPIPLLGGTATSGICRGTVTNVGICMRYD